MEKCVLKVVGQEANDDFYMEQLCGGVEAVIEGGIHVMRLLWVHHSQEDKWLFLLIY